MRRLSKSNKAERQPPLPGLHTSHVAPVAEPTIKTGIKAMTAAVMDLMQAKKD